MVGQRQPHRILFSLPTTIIDPQPFVEADEEVPLQSPLTRSSRPPIRQPLGSLLIKTVGSSDRDPTLDCSSILALSPERNGQAFMSGYKHTVLKLAFIWLGTCILSCFGEPRLPISTSLESFKTKLDSAGLPIIAQQYHLGWDLSSTRVHHWLTQILFKPGDLNPSVLYLGRDPSDFDTHLAVADFRPADSFIRVLKPPKFRSISYRQRYGLLAMKLRSHEEPHFIGVLWIKNKRTSQKVERFISRHERPLNTLENSETGLEDVQRVIHYQML